MTRTSNHPGASLHPDVTSYEGATALARGLTSYWHSRGFRNVECRVCRTDEDGKVQHATYGVRSNLRGGLPPGGVVSGQAFDGEPV